MILAALFMLIAVSGRADGGDVCLGRSQMVQAIAQADQADRMDSDGKSKNDIDWKVVSKRDRERREQIAKISADGCLKTAEDFAGAAIVYQHGNLPQDYFKAYSWSNKAVALGLEGYKTLAAMALDRYLMNIGRKQIYASQATERGGCWCLWPVEQSATDEDRRRMLRPGLSEELNWIDSLNAADGKTSCPKQEICSAEAAPVPHGSLPGVPW